MVDIVEYAFQRIHTFDPFVIVKGLLHVRSQPLQSLARQHEQEPGQRQNDHDKSALSSSHNQPTGSIATWQVFPFMISFEYVGRVGNSNAACARRAVDTGTSGTMTARRGSEACFGGNRDDAARNKA